MEEIEKAQRVILQNLPNAEAGLKEEIPESMPMMSMPSYHRRSVGADSQVLTSDESPYGSTPGHQRVSERYEQPLERLQIPQHPQVEEEEEESGGEPGPAKESSIPINHTTGANRLLLLQPIRNMCKQILADPKIKNIKYPIEQETNRGMLRLFGRGEGVDLTPGYDKDLFVDRGVDTTPGDVSSPGVVSTPSPTPTGEIWGQVGGLTPPAGSPGTSAPALIRGSIGIDGLPDLTQSTIKTLVDSYMESINIMHPLLSPNHLARMVDNFVRWMPENHSKTKQASAMTHPNPKAGFTRSNPMEEYMDPNSPGTKRKRSPGIGEHLEPHTIWDLKPGHPFRTMNTAIVLLVMALGAICRVKDKLEELPPDTYLTPRSDRDGASSWSNSPTIRNGHPPSPLQNSPAVATPIGMISPQDMDGAHARSRRTSITGQYNVRNATALPPRNLDVVPGLEYFALATDILGNQLGGMSLQHVHGHLLAGLYHGQLARVMESSSYICNAGRILQSLLRP